MLLAISFLFLGTLTQALKQDEIWAITLTVSDVAGSEYEGDLEVLFVPKDQKTPEHSTIIPPLKYELGQTYSFPLRLGTSDAPSALVIRTRGVCPLGLIPDDVLRVSKIELFSQSTKTTYSKTVKDLAIKDACQGVKGTEFTDFTVSQSTVCVIDGVKYNNGDKFEMGCVGRCECQNGSVACVDLCPAVAWGPDQKCHFTAMPGQCCEAVVCEENNKVNVCEELKPALVKNGKTTVPVRRYPWSVLYCTNANCTQIHSGIVVGPRHIMTYSADVSYLDSLSLSMGEYIIDQLNTSDFKNFEIVNVSAHPDFINQNSPIADSASRLQIVTFNRHFTFDKKFQYANLPFSQSHCSKLSQTQCPTMTVGWDLTDDDEPSIRQWFLHADKSKRDENACKNNPSTTNHPRMIKPKIRGEKRTCISGLVRSDCTGPLGGATVAHAANTDFVIGLLDPDTALLQCQNPGTAAMLPLCKYVDWIQTITSEF